MIVSYIHIYVSGSIWGLRSLSGLVVHPQIKKISHLMSNTSFHGILKNIEKLPNGDLQVGVHNILYGLKMMRANQSF